PWSEPPRILAYQLDTQRAPHGDPGGLSEAGRPRSEWIALGRSGACVPARAVQASDRAIFAIESQRQDPVPIWRPLTDACGWNQERTKTVARFGHGELGWPLPQGV